jgi:hypothetical protein
MVSLMMRRGGAFTGSVVACGWIAWSVLPTLAGAAGECGTVIPDTSKADPYGLREGRCEGMYLEQYSASVVPHSLTLGKVEVRKQDSSISLKWRGGVPGNVVDLLVKTFDCFPRYQMRVTVPAERGKYDWSNSILVRQSIPALGVQAKTIKGDYFPTLSDSATGTDEYYVAFCTSQTLNSVSIKVYTEAGDLVHAEPSFRAKKGPVVARVPASKFVSGQRYRTTLTSGAVTAGFRFQVP